MEVSYLNSFKNNNYKFSENFKSELLNINFFNKKIRKFKSNNNSLLKNSKLQFNKNKIENKINLILNKISENNINSLVIEFIKIISFINEDEYKKFFELLYKKIVNEIQFVEYYLNFFEMVIICYKNKMNYQPGYFFDLIEYKINNYYLNNEDKTNDKEIIRKNTLILIKKLINRNILDSNLLILLNSLILNQSRYIIDIFYWFENKKLSLSEKNKIKNKENLSFREKVFINNLLSKKLNENTNTHTNIHTNIHTNTHTNIHTNTNINTNTNKVQHVIEKKIKEIEINDNKNSIETFKIETKNIINEYIYLKILEEVSEYIKTECININSKNIFCKLALEIFFDLKFTNTITILNLFENLIKKKFLFKSNLSRGLLYLIKENKGKLLNDNRLKSFLVLLKKLGITKGLEFLLKKYKV
jgi:hypothetical protein